MSLPYRLGPSSMKGIGAFATRDLSAGDLIIAEKPLIAAGHMCLLPSLVQKLPADKRAIFESLVDSHLSPPPFGTFYNNAFDLGTINGVHTCAVFAEISRFNHSCDVNCDIRYIEHTGKMWVHANRDIKEGEELFVSYANRFFSREQRQDYLMDTFGFECLCAVCAGPEDTAGDKRRAMIAKFYYKPYDEQFRIAMMQPDHFVLMAGFALRKMNLSLPYHHDARQDAHDALAQAYVRAGDTHEAKVHYALAYAYTLIYSGTESTSLPRLLQNSKNPRLRSRIQGLKPYQGQKVASLCHQCGVETHPMECRWCRCGQYCSEACMEQHADIHLPACRILAPLKIGDETLTLQNLSLD